MANRKRGRRRATAGNRQGSARRSSQDGEEKRVRPAALEPWRVQAEAEAAQRKRLDPADLLKALHGSPPELTKSDRKSLEDRVHRGLFHLWVWMRASLRGREARNRVRALWIANAVAGATIDRLDRAELHRQNEKLRMWREVHTAIHARRGVRATDEEVWEELECTHGITDRTLATWLHPPRAAEDMIRSLSDRDVKTIDDRLARACSFLYHLPSEEHSLFWYHVARQNIQRIEAEGLFRERSDAAQPARLLAYRLLMDAVQYQVEVSRGNLDRLWFCFGCDTWHRQSRKVRPAKYLDALLAMQLRAAVRGGVSHGDRTSIYNEVKAEGKWEMPKLSTWHKFVGRHALRRDSDYRLWVGRGGCGHLHFYAWEPLAKVE